MVEVRGNHALVALGQALEFGEVVGIETLVHAVRFPANQWLVDAEEFADLGQDVGVGEEVGDASVGRHMEDL